MVLLYLAWCALDNCGGLNIIVLPHLRQVSAPDKFAYRRQEVVFPILGEQVFNDVSSSNADVILYDY